MAAVSGCDPLNLAGIVTPGVRVPAIYSNRVMYRDGVFSPPRGELLVAPDRPMPHG